MCDMIELDNERSAALLRNGLSKARIDADIYKWFKSYANHTHSRPQCLRVWECAEELWVEIVSYANGSM